jgi:DNA-binding NtrC family response regulator
LCPERERDRPVHKLMFIVDQGGVPVYSPDYGKLGLEVVVVQSMRKALSKLKSEQPDIICTELNYDPGFRDRVSNLEPLLAKLQSTSPDTRVIVFLEKEHESNLNRLKERFEIFDALYYPLQMEDILDSLQRAIDH